MRRALVTGYIFFVGLSGVHIFGQDTDVVDLPELVITPLRAETNPEQVPFSTQSVSAKKITMEKQARTTPEALRELPSVLLQKTGHGQASPFIRGFTGFRNLMLIDGIRLNNSVFREGPNQYWSTVDAHAIDQLELVKGPGSVMYGSDAIGGTVNALTKNVFDALPEGTDTRRRMLYRYSTAEDSHTGRIEAKTTLGEKAAVHLGGTYKNYGDLESGGGELPKTGYDEVDLDFRLDAILAPNLEMTVGHQTVIQEDAWRTHKTIFAVPFHGTTVGSEQKRVLDQERYLTYARFNGSQPSDVVDAYSLTLSHHRQGEEQFRIKKDFSQDEQGFDVDTFGVSLQLETKTDQGTWVYGVEFYHDEVDSYKNKLHSDGAFKSASIQGPVADDATYDTLGVYLQDQIPVSEDLEIVAGARYNYIEADADAFEDPISGGVASLSDNWDALVGSVRATYQLPTEQPLHLFAGISQGFRAPNLSDLTRLDTARSNEIETPSPNLDPEDFLAYEAGIKARTDTLMLEAAYYYTDIQDMIVRTPTGRMIDGNEEVTKKNAGDGFIHGVEVAGSVSLTETVSCWGNLSWMDGNVDGFPTSSPEKVTEPISRMMPLTGNVGLRLSLAREGWIEAVVSMADKQDDLSSRDKADTQRIPPGGTPGYGVATLRGGFKPHPDWTLVAALENLADKDYRVHGSGLNEPGRNFVITAVYEF